MDGLAQDGGTGRLGAEFARRLGPAADSDDGRMILRLIGQVHAVIEELRPTPEQMHRVIEFLTEVGQASDARRQEWVLLADVAGVSTLVEDLNAVRPAGATPNTVAGPFYRPDVPETDNGADLSRDQRGSRVAVSGVVQGIDGSPVCGALVEVWQANGDGVYENQEPDMQPEFNLRGKLRTDAQGRFAFLTMRPRGYALPGDGPVGRLFSGLGYPLVRPAHLHFRVTAPGWQVLTTHLFDQDDPAIGLDALFGVKPELLVKYQPRTDAEGRPSHALDVKLVLARPEPSGTAPGQ